MKVVATLPNEQDAYMLRDSIEAQGITVFIQNEGTGDIFNGMPFADIPIAVKDEDYPRALEIYRKWNARLEEE